MDSVLPFLTLVKYSEILKNKCASRKKFSDVILLALFFATFSCNPCKTKCSWPSLVCLNKQLTTITSAGTLND